MATGINKVKQHIDFGVYETNIPYEKEYLKEYREDQRKRNEQFKKDLLTALGITDHPKAERLFEIAWDHCHSNGLTEILYYAAELSELLDK